MRKCTLSITLVVFSAIWGCHMLGDKPPQIMTPENGAQVSEPYPLLTWSPCDSAHHYHLRVALDKNFQIVIGDTFIHETRFRLADSLKIGDSLYWSVSTISQKAVHGPWSKIHSFKRAPKPDNTK